MASINVNPQDVLAAFRHLSQQWPELIGASEWAQIGDAIRSKIETLDQCEDEDQQWLLTTELIETVAPYDAARERLQTELYLIAGVRKRVQPLLDKFAQRFGMKGESSTIALNAALQVIAVEIDKDEGRTRYVEIDKGGLGGGKQVRLRNIALDHEAWIKLVVGFLPTLTEPKPWLFALGLLLAVWELKELAEVEIEEQEATVFWGLLHGCSRPNHPAKEHLIIDSINKERTRFELGQLTEEEIRTSLTKLKNLGVIEPIGDEMWQFVERCYIL